MTHKGGEEVGGGSEPGRKEGRKDKGTDFLAACHAYATHSGPLTQEEEEDANPRHEEHRKSWENCATAPPFKMQVGHEIGSKVGLGNKLTGKKSYEVWHLTFQLRK